MINDINNTLKSKPWFFSITITIGVFLLGLSIIITQSVQSYDTTVLKRFNTILTVIENKLDETNEIINKTKPLIGEPCSTIQQKLVDMIVTYSQFQTLSIIKNNIVACSSYSRMIGVASVNPERPNHLLTILESNIITPGKIIGAIKEVHDNTGILVTFNGQIFYSILENIEDSDNYRIQSSTIWFDNKGVIHHTDQKSNLILPSEKYNFNINTNITIRDYINNIIENYIFIIILFSAVSLIIGRYVLLNTQKKSGLYMMKESIENNEFFPYAQPVMKSNGELAGIEILIRWNNKHHGLVSPDVFIPLAETSGLIIPMTSQLIDNTFNLLIPLKEKIPHGFHIGFNISAQHFSKSNQQSLIESCKKYKKSPLYANTHLVLELTERQGIDDYNEAKAVFDTLHNMDIKLAIDDFGTGHSTLSYIKHLNFDYIKIDQSFISLIGSEAIAAPLVDNIIDLANRLNLSIVAEGVETQEQLDYLITHNVDYIQGYFYEKPIPLTEFIKRYFLS